MAPEAVMADFEEALTKGFINVFPWAVVYNDYFHFMQANVRQLGQMGLQSKVQSVKVGLHSLWYAPGKKEFNSVLVPFLAEWDKHISTYTSYFQRNWLEHYPPERWASFGRPGNASSGI
jgi:hypothetical protein